MGMNVVAISGNLTRPPELRQTQGGTSILNFNVAVNERRKNSQGQWEDYANFIDVCVFGRRADSLGKILSKGMKVAVSGKLRYSSWENKEGQKRSKLEVVADEIELMSQRSQSQQNGSYAPQQQQQANYSQQQQYAPQNGYQQPVGGYQQQGYQQPDLYSEPMPF